MNYFVFRNNTVERFFPKGFSFSGYEDISSVPEDADGYVWFYQLPVKYSEAKLCEQVGDYARQLAFVLAKVNPAKPFILFTMESGLAVPFASGVELMAAVADYNASLMALEREHSNVKLLEISEFTRRYPASELYDWKFWFISQMGLNPRLAKPFAEWFARKLDEISSKRKKCLVMDLDNTLWGGVLGEDGVEGIKLGGDYPGKAFHLFQEGLLELKRSGVMLAVCSKNNEADVLDLWQRHPDMVLRADSFVAWRINWADKATGIRELSDELNIGLDSIVFVDDNPSERALVRQALPEVEVPDFPSQPYELPVLFQSLVEKYFRIYTVTAEDAAKTEQYKANAQRAQYQRDFVDMEAFLKSLDIRLTIEAANEFNIPRIAQLTQKTNQFNLTIRRYTESDVRQFLQRGWKIWCLSVQDRFGDDGITGCIMVDGNAIDTFLLSCRILGKGIEFAFAKGVLSMLKDQGLKTVSAQFIPSAKNGQTSGFYEALGFSCVAERDGVKDYLIDLDSADLSIKDYYRIKIQ